MKRIGILTAGGDTPALNATVHGAVVRANFGLEHMINFVTPGFATAVYVAAEGIRRVRATAEGRRRIAVIEVMGRHSGSIALGSAYDQPDLILVPEHPLDLDWLVKRVQELYELQKNAVIVCGEGIVDAIRSTLFSVNNLVEPHHSLNTEVAKRIRYLHSEA